MALWRNWIAKREMLTQDIETRRMELAGAVECPGL